MENILSGNNMKRGYYILDPKHFENRIDLFHFDGHIPKDWVVDYDGWPFVHVVSKAAHDIGKPIGYLAKDMKLATNHEVITRLFRQ
jgi:hypothetical protein